MTFTTPLDSTPARSLEAGDDWGVFAYQLPRRVPRALVQVSEGQMVVNAAKKAAAENPSPAEIAMSNGWGKPETTGATARMNGKPCGPTDDLGYCRSSTHSMDCSRSMTTGVHEATAAPREKADRAWESAAAERSRMLGPAAASRTKAKFVWREARAAEEKARMELLQRHGARWMTDH